MRHEFLGESLARWRPPFFDFHIRFWGEINVRLGTVSAIYDFALVSPGGTPWISKLRPLEELGGGRV